MRDLRELKAEKESLLENTSDLSDREKKLMVHIRFCIRLCVEYASYKMIFINVFVTCALQLAEEASKKYIAQLEDENKGLKDEVEKTLENVAQKQVKNRERV